MLQTLHFAHAKQQNAQMDDTDRELISLLRADARAPVVALAKKLKVARATVQNRIAKLEADGTIVGYTVRLKPEAEQHRIRALTTIEVEGNHGEDVRRTLRGHPNVVALHTTNGRWDLIAELRTDSLEAFDEVLNNIRRVKGITSTETSILLSTHKHEVLT
jgi:DNA-binding Lrp family transcriptional regulator